jgi:hypothetical protein
MVERQNGGFGKRGVGGGPSFGGSRPLAGEPASKPLAERHSPHTIYRPGETERPTFHNSHIELHWPKYLAAAAFVFALAYLVNDGKTDPFGLTVVPLLFAAISYFALNKVRKSLNDLHVVRTQSFRSPAFLAGGALGLGYFIYSTFISPEMIMGQEWGLQTAFADGFQQADLGAVAMLLLKAAGMIVAGGLLIEFISKRLFGATGGSE